MRTNLKKFAAALMLAISLMVYTTTADSLKADDVIKSVQTLGFVDGDGSKTNAIVVKYGVDLTGADLDVDTFQINDYGTSLSANKIQMGSNPGVALKAYVNDEPATSATGGSGTGNYVIIEVNTDYQTTAFTRSWKITMAAGVKQIKTIKTANDVIAPSTKEVGNYTVQAYIGIDPMTGGNRAPEYYNYANDGTYTIKGIEDYQLHTIASIDGDTGYSAFHATNCFDEANGKYWNFDLPYALYVPKDYDSSKKYALVLHIHDAGSMSTNPMLTLTEAQGPSNYASAAFQQLAKDQGLDGAIIVCPEISEAFPMDANNPSYNLRISRDNWTLSCAAPAIWELMDSLTGTYNIDKNHIYGSGQSMGGMTIMALAAQRDNYFAAIMPMSCVWGTNFNKDYKFNGSVCYNAPADGTIIWNKDADGNPCDYNNWFYMCSDDNILYLNTDSSPEYMMLFKDLCGVDVENADMVLTTDTTVAKRNALVKELVSRKSALGIYQVTLSGNVSHMSAWFYGHSTFACYEWLMNQTRETEMARGKLNLNKPYKLADVQIHTDDRVYSTEKDGTVIYYPTGKLGAGTIGYNSPCTALGSNAKLYPGWKPEK
ncbi:hypothetical protein SPSIL_048760 [Sporomusa silvacetica DSM 10669]|uniref:Esterase Ig-like N-terminal domain-containing protein n=1 Tax=Sporomusa silvacetica DSM 10669 TaxID=1123289 RepID=A0ABZ3ITF3_9FIRM|nr:alpha/beta hydrolase-fold protein [Sporomusa silvacetica]OZC14645.1 putative esterase [Sporomusa silvacetica DSM 10669]